MWTFTTENVVSLLLENGTWVQAHKNAYGLMCFDPPWNILRGLRSDRPWLQEFVQRLTPGMYQVIEEDGNVVIILGEWGHDIWRAALIEAGFDVHDIKVPLPHPVQHTHTHTRTHAHTHTRT